MFVVHLLAFVGWSATHDLPRRLPYWWGFVLIYPVVGLVLARRRVLSGWRVACSLCSAPFLYFFLLGVTEGRWSVSDYALDGVQLAIHLERDAGWKRITIADSALRFGPRRHLGSNPTPF